MSGPPYAYGGGGGQSTPTFQPIDANDLLVWRCTDLGTATSLANSGPGGAAGNLSLGGSAAPGSPSRWGTSFYLQGSVIDGTTKSQAYGAATIAPTSALTVACWVFPVSFPTGSGYGIFYKGYRDKSTWSSPYQAFGLYGGSGLDNGFIGPWGGNIACGTNGAGTRYAANVTNKSFMRAGQWHHLGMTWSGATNLVSLYFDGVLDSTFTTGTSGLLDTNSNAGQYIIGAPPGAGSNEQACMIVNDARVCTIARPASWFLAAYQMGNP